MGICHLIFMVEIIPAIIAKDFEDLEKKIKLVEPYVQTVQLDVMDGIFIPNKTWNKPRELEKLKTNLFLEAHLMVAEPERVTDEWLASKVKRIILHWEAIKEIFNLQFSIYNLIEQIHNGGKEFGVALNLETPISVLDNFINYIDMVLMMSVKPGRGGQEFEESVIPKIIALRQKYPSVKIEVDGGIDLENIKKLAEAGANFLAVGSAIFESKNIGRTIEELKQDIK